MSEGRIMLCGRIKRNLKQGKRHEKKNCRRFSASLPACAVRTGYALWKGAWREAGERGNVFWITRTPGYTHANVVYVDESGYMYNRGILVTCRDTAVIPVLVLDLDSAVYEYAGVYTAGER